MGRLEIQLFGTLSLERDGMPLTRFPSKRVGDLLSFLVLNRDVLHARDRLAGLFWGDLDDDNARHCLNTALWRLRQLLRADGSDELPYLRSDARGIGFNPASDVRLDVAEFEARCTLAAQLGPGSAEQRAALYAQAVALYRDDLLVDCYDDWCLVERERLQLLYLGALGHLLAYETEHGEYAAAREAGRRILERDPLREDVHRSLMQLELRAGQPAAALRRYQACEGLLRRELGVAPMPETQALLPHILAGVKVVPRQAPAPRLAPATTEPVAAALALLAEAASALERAGEQLREVSALLQGPVAAPGAGRPAGRQVDGEPVAARLRQASRLLEDVARGLVPQAATPQKRPARASR